MATNVIQKRFPANTTLDDLTFLNDKNVDAELYAYLQTLSRPVGDKEHGFVTVVSKRDIPKQSKLCEIFGFKSPKTLRAHLQYLIEKGFVMERADGDYSLPEMERFYFLIPLKTLKYFNDTLKEPVIKVYIYLGQKYKQALNEGKMYEFTSEELGEHIGIRVKNNSRGYEYINNILTCLYNSGLIKYCSYFDGQMQKKKLTHFSFEYNENPDE